MAKKVYGAIALTGGDPGALDAIDGALLSDEDMAIVSVKGAGSYIYSLDASSGATEDSPNVIAPDANAGTKRWVLSESYNKFSGNKNKLRNGGFDVAQRGGGPTTLSAGQYLVDGFGTFNYQQAQHSRQAFTGGGEHPGNSKYHLRIAGTGSTTWLNSGQPVEHIDAVKLRGETITLSGYARFSAASWSVDPLSVIIKLGYTTGTADSAVGVTDYIASGAVEVPYTQGNLPTSWQKFSVSIDIPATANNIAFYVQTGQAGSFATTDYIELSQVKLEEGPIATPFEQRTYAEELALCRRYYRRIGEGVASYSGTGTDLIFTNTFNPSMRTSPTGTLLLTNVNILEVVTSKAATAGTMINTSSTPNSYRGQLTGFSGLTAGLPGIIVSNDWLELSAEL